MPMRAKFKGFPTKRSTIELGKKMALSQDLAGFARVSLARQLCFH